MEATVARKRRRQSRLLDPVEVLRGRARADIEDIFRLIHDVNPTDRGLTLDAEAEGYRLKSALQSLLIREHAHALVVEVDEDDPDLVSLRHVSGVVDACHARLHQLDDDARSWVRRQLDLADGDTEPGRLRPSTYCPVPASQDLLAQGRVALEAYDFDQARARFEAALEETRGAEPAAVLYGSLYGNSRE